MEVIAIYSIPYIGDEYELYKAASGDYCVIVNRYGLERENYTIGTKEEALAFILKNYEM